MNLLLRYSSVDGLEEAWMGQEWFFYRIQILLSHDEDIENILFKRSFRGHGNSQNEMERYLNDENLTTGSMPLLEQWQNLESAFPTVARMARDILAIPLTGVFNTARDTCHYRRSRCWRAEHGHNLQMPIETYHPDQHLLQGILIGT
ncbi:predicted protein [Uncinocarpus reesii 1704]|uniref:HAT C-terminal dimerisation domain-containing protein n=1 Tax=Uncinocarpus reesii (strain UAMH 1704) TaxID=336963 RepID=C4JZV8_UNCRE|nr:uncharacterized protein UREG_07709 [Uncinocarpus reesii 1704]EEP82844.1 predicted protein [Uncinocarpus reesii 1704]